MKSLLADNYRHISGGSVLKRLVSWILTLAVSVAGNLLAAAIQQDAWQNLFTPERLCATGVGAVVMLVVLAALESERGLAWNWPWHRFWYLRGLVANPQIRQWESDFARLNLAQGKRPFTTTEVIAAGERRDMVSLLYDAFLQKGNHGRQMLVLGEPGAGKTTGLERLTLELARQKVWQLGIGCPMPILLRLGNYQSGDLIAFVAAEMGRSVGGQSGVILGKGLETLLAKGNVLLLCDALDEALGEQRNMVLAELDRFLRSPRYARVGVVITARTREDPGGRLPDLPVYTIQDLHDEAVKAFVRVYHPPGVEEGEIIGRLTKVGLLEPGGLGRNPFWLRIVVESGVFQGEKGKILDQAVNTLLQREWDKPEAERSGWQRVLPRDQQITESRQALAWLAYQMFVGGLVVVEKIQGLDWLGAALKQQGSSDMLRAAHVVGLGRDAQLLTYLSDKLRFRHRLLQEALMAWLLAGDEALRAEAIDRYADDTAWWETLLMLGHLVAEPEKLIETVLAGDSEQRLFLAAGMLQGIERPSVALRLQVMDALSQSMSQGITEGHKAAVSALAQIVRDDVLALLRELFWAGKISWQSDILALLVSLDGDTVQNILCDPDLPSVRRAEIGRALEQIGDMRPGVGVIERNGVKLPDIVWSTEIPAGIYTIGNYQSRHLSSSDDHEEPSLAKIDWPFRLARYPITNAQFQCFLDAKDRDNLDWWEGTSDQEQRFGEPQWTYANHPRENVSWYQAMAFCRWLTHKLHHGLLPAESLTSDLKQYTITLPHEYEWEVAARWPNDDGQLRIYPWGPEFDPQKANTGEGRVGQTTAVGMYPSGKNSALELYDLSGNVWEWCRNKYEPLHDEAVDDNRNLRVLRGGSWTTNRFSVRTDYRLNLAQAKRDLDYGFRVAVVYLPSHHPDSPKAASGDF